jgi:hypothetical protein
MPAMSPLKMSACRSSSGAIDLAPVLGSPATGPGMCTVGATPSTRVGVAGTPGASVLVAGGAVDVGIGGTAVLVGTGGGVGVAVGGTNDGPVVEVGIGV